MLDDDGQTVDGPGPLARQAFENGVKYVSEPYVACIIVHPHFTEKQQIQLRCQYMWRPSEPRPEIMLGISLV